MTRINLELQQIAGAIVSGVTLPTTVTSRDDQVHAATFVEGEKAILVVVNPTAQPQRAGIVIGGIGSQKGKGVFGEDNIDVRNGRIRCELSAREVRVYELELRRRRRSK